MVSDLQVSVKSLRGTAVLVDHAAEHLTALHRRIQWHDDQFVMIGWPLLPGLMGPMPVLVFDASTNAQYDVTSLYHYDGVAAPVKRVAGEWMISSVYIGSQYKQNARGRNVLSHGKPVSNEGYTVAVFALLVPDSVGDLLYSVMAHDDKRLLKPLPARPLANAELDTIRNNVAKECPRRKS
jgi:hypothetical protein